MAKCQTDLNSMKGKHQTLSREWTFQVLNRLHLPNASPDKSMANRFRRWGWIIMMMTITCQQCPRCIRIWAKQVRLHKIIIWGTLKISQGRYLEAQALSTRPLVTRNRRRPWIKHTAPGIKINQSERIISNSKLKLSIIG